MHRPLKIGRRVVDVAAAGAGWPVEFHGDGRALHACMSPWNAAEFGLMPAVLYP
jgi:hypothetical protein